ncbi:hypothetical protein BDQ12DRAFT_689224 [Crucibulum laeve]|uniref:Uncharacterized protein n=1 Tax=Crucibulum laeve TaxID=68775 RepID=A0A5C3LRY0_9AGAR|nr:hypothetical protein BDQ12DRAFT_689224 [Crucibulum laeve]
MHVQDMIDRQTSTATGAMQLRTDEKFGNEQMMCVLSGYWSLVSFWEDVRKKPLEVQCADACNKEAHAKCVATWEKRWNSAVGWKRILGHNSADVLALLACLRDQLSGDDELREGVAPACRLAGLKALNDKLEHTREHLVDYFLAVYEGTAC